MFVVHVAGLGGERLGLGGGAPTEHASGHGDPCLKAQPAIMMPRLVAECVLASALVSKFITCSKDNIVSQIVNVCKM